MKLKVRAAAQKTYRDYVDISKYTGMEIEHKHDTENLIPHINELHTSPFFIKPFVKESEKVHAEVREKALK